MSIDINEIDRKIKQNFVSEFNKLPQYIEKLKSLKELKGLNSRIQSGLNKTINNLEKYIYELEKKNFKNSIKSVQELFEAAKKIDPELK